MKVIIGEYFSDVYKKILEHLVNCEEIEVRGKKTKEELNLYLTIKNPEYELFENEVRSIPLRYLAGELIWYFSGRDDVEFISKYSKFWKNIQNDDGTANSAYGKLIFKDKNKFGYTQFDWAYEKLIEDKYTRQAIIHFNNENHQFKGNKDFVCTVYGIFNIRKNKLNFFIAMRSSDAIRGLTFDIPFFILIQKIMFLKLKEKYKDLEIGEFSMLLNSSHIYEEHYELVEKMLKKEFIPKKLPKINSNIILNKNLKNIQEYNGNDEFLNWLKKYSK